MITLLSPAKTQEVSRTLNTAITQPLFLEKTKELIDYLSSLSQKTLKTTMKVSDKIAQTSFDSFRTWRIASATQALALFSGDAFSTLDAVTLNEESLAYAQQNIRILSGLYGSLRPFDEVRPYRLEMAYKFEEYPSLYTFWKKSLTQELSETILRDNHTTIINLASGEYAKALDFKRFSIPVITPQFRESKEGKLKTISIYAKRARGACLRYILENQISEPKELKNFSWNGYSYDKNLGTDTEWFFTRE